MVEIPTIVSGVASGLRRTRSTAFSMRRPRAVDVVFLRVNGKQAMSLHDAMPDIRFEGKPQCHIIPIAKEMGQVALSVGCMLSRTRTGMTNNEMTCAIPVGKLGEVVAKLGASCKADKAVASYAAEDARRFGHRPS